MKLIQNILAIDFILCLARHWLSNFKTSAYPLYWPGEDKGGGGGNIPSYQLVRIAFYLTNSRGLRNRRFLHLGSVRDPVTVTLRAPLLSLTWRWLKDRTQHIGGAAAGQGPRTEEILFIRKKLYHSHRTGYCDINGSIAISFFLQLEEYK